MYFVCHIVANSYVFESFNVQAILFHVVKHIVMDVDVIAFYSADHMVIAYARNPIIKGTMVNLDSRANRIVIRVGYGRGLL